MEQQQQIRRTGPDVLRRSLRSSMLVGGTMIGLFFAGFGGWSALAPLASGALAPGIVSPDGNRKTIQHLEGGIIRDILVQDGAVVRQGQVLMVLEDKSARAAYDQVEAQHRMYAAIEARLRSEQIGAAEVEFPDWLLVQADDPAVAEILTAQRNLFHARRDALQERRVILGQRIAQLQEEIAGLEAQIVSQSAQGRLTDEELAAVSELYKQGLEKKPRLLALQRAKAEITGTRASYQASIARSQQAIGEAQLQIVALDTQRLEEVGGELAKVKGEIATVREKVRTAEDVLRRTVIRAPVDGTVMQLRYRTPGGVVTAGQPILDLVPAGDEMLIDARVAPSDIDVVRAGLSAQVHLSAYQQRNLPRIEGRVRTVSADSLVDSVSGQRYFLARVEVDREKMRAVAPDIEMSPGMPAEVLVMTGERTLLQYMLRPFLDSFRRSFRES